MRSYANITLLAAVSAISLYSTPARAQFVYDGQFSVADFQVGIYNNNLLNPDFEDHREWLQSTDADLLAQGDYTGTRGIQTDLETFNGHGFARLQTSLGTTSIHTAFSSDAVASLVSNGHGYQPGSLSDVSVSLAFHPTQSGDFLLTATGEITAMMNSGVGTTISYDGKLVDSDTNAETVFVLADQSRSITPFSQQLSLVGGHHYYFTWSASGMAVAPGSGAPSTSEVAMNGTVDLEPVPEPASMLGVAMGIVALSLRKRLRRHTVERA